jgi:vacuolar iron transporter family protein
MAGAVSGDPDTALRVHTREELGVDPEELLSAVLASVASLLAFSLGALVPLLPYLLGYPVLAATLAVTAVTLIAGGAAVGRLTGRSRRPAVLRPTRRLPLSFASCPPQAGWSARGFG